MDGYGFTIIILYLIVAVMDFAWMVHTDDEDGVSSPLGDFANLVFAILWPLHLIIELVCLVVYYFYKTLVWIVTKSFKLVIDLLEDIYGE